MIFFRVFGLLSPLHHSGSLSILARRHLFSREVDLPRFRLGPHLQLPRSSSLTREGKMFSSMLFAVDYSKFPGPKRSGQHS